MDEIKNIFQDIGNKFGQILSGIDEINATIKNVKTSSRSLKVVGDKEVKDYFQELTQEITKSAKLMEENLGLRRMVVEKDLKIKELEQKLGSLNA